MRADGCECGRRAETVRVNAERLGSAVADIFAGLGIARGDAQLVANDMVLADLEGVVSHGVMLVPMYVDRIQKGSVSKSSLGDSSATTRPQSSSMPATRSDSSPRIRR